MSYSYSQLCFPCVSFPFFLFLTSVSPPRHLLAAAPHFRKYNIRVEDIMVRDVRFITLNSSYRELQEMLVTSYLKTLALVESRGERRTCCCLWSLSLLLNSSSPFGSNINSIVKSFIMSYILTVVFIATILVFLSTVHISCCNSVLLLVWPGQYKRDINLNRSFTSLTNC